MANKAKPLYFNDFLGELLQHDALSHQERAALCGVHPNTLQNARMGLNLSIATLRKIEAGFADLGLKPGMLTGTQRPRLSLKLELAG